LFTSHNMREVQHMCDPLFFLDHGKLIASGSPLEVTRSLLREVRTAPALEEAFIHVVGREAHGAI
jgi:ABC-2 type transport system ATP-binding protein